MSHAPREAAVRSVLARHVPASVHVDADTLAPFLAGMLEEHSGPDDLAAVLEAQLGSAVLARTISAALLSSGQSFADAFAGAPRSGSGRSAKRDAASAPSKTPGASRGGKGKGRFKGVPVSLDALGLSVGVPVEERETLSDEHASVCRFYVAGSCTREDCPFLHDTSTVPCKFFLAGECSAGASCRFLHPSMPAHEQPRHSALDGWDDDALLNMLAENMDALRAVESRADEPLDTGEASFPSLHGSHTSHTSHAAHAATEPSTAHASHTGDAARVAGSQAGSATQRDTGLFDALFRFAPRTQAPRTHTHTHAHASTRKPEHSRVADDIARSLPVVSTGEAVAALYATHRREAEAVARARNVSFEKATAAHTAGRRALAAELAREGRALDERMHRMHAEAADAIFAARNGGVPLREARQLVSRPVCVRVRGSGEMLPVCVLDMHGLHPNEAARGITDVLSACLEPSRAGARSGPTWLAVLAGARTHSHMLGRGGGSVPDAVIDAAREVGADVDVYQPTGLGAASPEGVILLRAARA